MASLRDLGLGLGQGFLAVGQTLAQQQVQSKQDRIEWARHNLALRTLYGEEELRKAQLAVENKKLEIEEMLSKGQLDLGFDRLSWEQRKSISDFTNLLLGYAKQNDYALKQIALTGKLGKEQASLIEDKRASLAKDIQQLQNFQAELNRQSEERQTAARETGALQRAAIAAAATPATVVTGEGVSQRSGAPTPEEIKAGIKTILSGIPTAPALAPVPAPVSPMTVGKSVGEVSGLAGTWDQTDAAEYRRLRSISNDSDIAGAMFDLKLFPDIISAIQHIKAQKTRLGINL